MQSGEHAGQERYKACFPKAHKRWVVKSLSKKKSYQHLSTLLAQVLEWCETGNAVAESVPVVFPATLQQNQHQIIMQYHNSSPLI